VTPAQLVSSADTRSSVSVQHFGAPRDVKLWDAYDAILINLNRGTKLQSAPGG
jgi:hypothetical protein